VSAISLAIDGLPFGRASDSTAEPAVKNSIVELKRLCQEARTGIFFITTAENHIAQISLDGGAIVFLVFLGRQGFEAVPLLQGIRVKHTRFTETTVSVPVESSLPTTADILSFLEVANEMPVSATVEATDSVSDRGLSEAIRELLQEELAEIIGPMAMRVCQRRLAGIADLKTAIQTLGEVLEAEQINQFQAGVLRRLHAAV